MTQAQTKQTLAEATINDPRWQSVLARDGKAGFVYSVESTGVYCRASCAARLPRPENVRFHATCSAAEGAGFRPCKRCRPNHPSLPEQHAATIALLCRRIEEGETEPSLAELAASASMSLFHFHRVFRAVTGLTPKQYATAHRRHTVRGKLRTGTTVTEAIYDAGYGASSRFYSSSSNALGMTPSAFRAGGKDETIYFVVGETSLGSLLVARSERGICAILLGDDPAHLLQGLEDSFPHATLLGGDAGFEQTIARVVGLVEAPHLGIDLPLDIRGTVFQQRVWQALRTLPAGSKASYTEIAEAIGAPASIRAVARACAANTLAVAIPCHRVVRRDGNLSGYRWGIERKRLLLEREAHVSGHKPDGEN